MWCVVVFNLLGSIGWGDCFGVKWGRCDVVKDGVMKGRKCVKGVFLRRCDLCCKCVWFIGVLKERGGFVYGGRSGGGRRKRNCMVILWWVKVGYVKESDLKMEDVWIKDLGVGDVK